MYLKLGQVPAIVVSSSEVAKEVLKDADPNFADRLESQAVKIITYNYIDMGFCPYGEYWRQTRKICVLELLSVKKVRSFSSIRTDEASRFVSSIRLCSGNPLNLTKELSSLLTSIVARAAFGNVCKNSDAFATSIKHVLHLSGGFAIADLFPSFRLLTGLNRKLLIARRKVDMILDDIIIEHIRKPSLVVEKEKDEDFVDVLLRIKYTQELEFPIDNDNIKALLFDMFAAGTDSSVAVITWTMTELMRNPQVMAKAQSEVRQVFKGNDHIIEEHHIDKLKYLKLVIKESLRLHPPGGILFRTCREECKISGYTIPAKTKVLVNVWAMQRDPKYWTDPESFQPERFEIDQSIDYTGSNHFEYLPFGRGKRICPGIVFALANVELILAQLLYNFNWKLPDGVEAQDLDMTENLGLSASRRDDLFLLATSYQTPLVS